MADKAYQIAFEDEPVDDDFYDSVVALTVDESTDGATSFRMQVSAAPDGDGSWSLLDDPRLTLFTRVSIQIGFTGGGGVTDLLGGLADIAGGGNDGLQWVFEGYVTGVEVNLSAEPDASSIEVTGLDESVLLSLEEKTATWSDLSDSDIVQRILGDHGIDVQLDTTPTVHQQNDTTIVQRGSDLQLVRELARRNGREFYFEADDDTGVVVGYFRAPQLGGTPQPDLAIQFGEASNLHRFTARLGGQRPLSVRIDQLDVKSNAAVQARADATGRRLLGDRDVDTLVAQPLREVLAPSQTLAQMLVLGPPTSDATEMQTIAQAARDEAAWIVTAEGEINGDAYQRALRPRRTVLVKGAGTYSGRYYVTRVVHHLAGDGGYTQTFEARRNALEAQERDVFGDPGLAADIPGL